MTHDRIDIYSLSGGYAAHTASGFRKWFSLAETRKWAADNGFTVRRLKTPRTATFSTFIPVKYELVKS